MTERTAAEVFDVDEWIRLWQEDPDVAKRQRLDEIEATIMSAPEEKRQMLRQLQWRIDMELARHHNPMGRCVALYRMLMDHLWSERGLFVAVVPMFQEVKVELEKLLASLSSVCEADAHGDPGKAPMNMAEVPTSGPTPPQSCIAQALRIC